MHEYSLHIEHCGQLYCLQGKERHRHRSHAKGSVDQSPSKGQQGGECTVLMRTWHHTSPVPRKQNLTRKPKQPAAAEQATKANTVPLKVLVSAVFHCCC